MSSTTTSTSSSSSSSEIDDRGGRGAVVVVGGRSQGGGSGGGGGGGGGDYQSEQPSSSRQRSSNEDFPDLFIESLAYQVAIDAIASTSSANRLDAAQAVCMLFQVCTTWNSISHSPTLWHNLNRYVWRVDHPLPRITTHWRDEFIVHHRRYRNFRQSRFVYSTLDFVSQELYRSQCRCLAISDTHLACGFLDGTVRLFQLPQRVHTRTFPPHDRDRFGPLSWSVMGIALTTNHNNNVIFGTVDGNIYAAELYAYESRRVHQGNLLNDGSLIDFAGNSEWWVGLYAGVPGCSFRVWNGRSETLVYVGGSLTDPDSVFGWRMLTEYLDPIGRVRIAEACNVVVACSRTRIMGFDLRRPELILNDEEVQEGARVSTFDAGYDSFVLVNNRRMATVRRVDDFGVVCRFSTRSRHFGGIGFGCQNRDFALMSYYNQQVGSPIRVWGVERGHRLYDIGENVQNLTTLIADERYMVACSADTRIHFWDHGNDEENEE